MKKIIKKAKPISDESIKIRKQAKKAFKDTEKSIIKRVDYIINTIFKTFKIKNSYWYFYGAEEGSHGDIDKGIYKDVLLLELENNYAYADFYIIDKNNDEWSFEEGFPLRWLFENFEQELIDGKKLYELKDKEKRDAVTLATNNKKKLIKQVKSKLNKEELEALLNG